MLVLRQRSRMILLPGQPANKERFHEIWCHALYPEESKYLTAGANASDGVLNATTSAALIRHDEDLASSSALATGLDTDAVLATDCRRNQMKRQSSKHRTSTAGNLPTWKYSWMTRRTQLPRRKRYMMRRTMRRPRRLSHLTTCFLGGQQQRRTMTRRRTGAQRHLRTAKNTWILRALQILRLHREYAVRRRLQATRKEATSTHFQSQNNIEKKKLTDSDANLADTANTTSFASVEPEAGLDKQEVRSHALLHRSLEGAT